jgi:hypothetical protein
MAFHPVGWMCPPVRRTVLAGRQAGPAPRGLGVPDGQVGQEAAGDGPPAAVGPRSRCVLHRPDLHCLFSGRRETARAARVDRSAGAAPVYR